MYVHSNDLKSRLSFNLGLAFLRWKKNPEAAEWLESVLSDELAGVALDDQQLERRAAIIERLRAEPQKLRPQGIRPLQPNRSRIRRSTPTIEDDPR